jgi:hypothetical protein
MTVAPSYFKGLEKFGRIFDLPLGRGLVYGGDEHQRRSGALVYPVTMVHELLAELEQGSMMRKRREDRAGVQ